MKRFLTALAVSALLITGGVVSALDHTWNVAVPVGNWAVGPNWVPGLAFPGSATRTYDREIISNAGVAAAIIVTFAAADGDPTFGLNSRLTSELMIDSTTTAFPITLKVDGAKLYPGRTTLKSDASANITVDLNAGRFEPDDLDVEACVTPEGETESCGTITFELDVDMKVTGKTVMKGDVDIDFSGAAAGTTFDVGRLVIKGRDEPFDTVVRIKAAGGVLESS